MSRVVQVLFQGKEFVGTTESGSDDAFVVLKNPAQVLRFPTGPATSEIRVTALNKMPDYLNQDLRIPNMQSLTMELNPDGTTYKTYLKAISGLVVPNGRQVLQAAARRQ